MAPIKSGIARVLRSKAPNSNPRILNTMNRHLTRTAQNATSIENSRQPSSSTPFFLADFQPNIPPQHTASSTTKYQSPSTTSFDTLISSITHSLKTASKPDLRHLNELLRAYTSIPSHWSNFALQDPSQKYTRNLIAQVPGVFNLLMLVWTPGKASPVHDHADAHCLMKVLKGELRERRYAIPTDPGNQGALVQTSDLRFKLDEVSYMADILGLHEISNPSSSEYAVSLHLYTPPNAALRGCHVYDKDSGSATHVMQNFFYSVSGKLSS